MYLCGVNAAKAIKTGDVEQALFSFRWYRSGIKIDKTKDINYGNSNKSNPHIERQGGA